MALGVLASDLTVKNLTVNAANTVALSVSNSKATVDGCTFNGGYTMGTYGVVTVNNFSDSRVMSNQSTLTLKNSVSVENFIFNNNSGENASIVFTTGGTYTINGIIKTPTSDYSVTDADSDIVIWSE